MTKQIIIIGGGIIGATIAYELSQTGLNITLLEQKNQPALGATSAALGVLMGVISQKVKGNSWKLRYNSISRYRQLIPELEQLIQRKISWNPHGILILAQESDRPNYENLQKIRHQQGLPLELWELSDISSRFSHLNLEETSFGIYSPLDLQVDPVDLTLALIEGGKKIGVTYRFGVEVLNLVSDSQATKTCYQIATNQGVIPCDAVIITAGLGTTNITRQLGQTIDINPVLGQAIALELPKARSPLPVITKDDIHIVPISAHHYWIGATVEFIEGQDITPSTELLQKVIAAAIKIDPALADGTIIKTWSGLRPRPHNRPAPIIEPLPQYHNIFLATGHYRNGILLAPGTAIAIRELIQNYCLKHKKPPP